MDFLQFSGEKFDGVLQYARNKRIQVGKKRQNLRASENLSFFFVWFSKIVGVEMIYRWL